jgi:signal transduction histidine kinase
MAALHVSSTVQQMSEAREQQPHQRLIDAGLALGAALVLVLLTFIASETGARSLDGVGFGLTAAIGLLLFWRRSHPTAVAVASLVVLLGYHALGYPAIGSIPLVFALANASYRGYTRSAIVVATLAVGGALVWFLVGEELGFSDSVNLVVRDAGVLVASVLLGAVLRSRRQLTEESRVRLRLARAEQEARMIEERMTIAREIHDVLAHTVTLIGVQTKVAIEAADDSREDVLAALNAIKASTENAAAEVRATIGVLRGSASLAPVPGLDEIDLLAESMSTSDLTVEVFRSGERREVSDLIGLVAYRVVQEALTNVAKHSSADRAAVDIRFNSSEVVISVVDDGVGGDIVSGFGLAGMKERVTSIGGTLKMDQAESGGVRVVARLPTDGPR